MSKYQQILNQLECADAHDYETAQSAALAIRALEAELEDAKGHVKRLLAENARLEREREAHPQVNTIDYSDKGVFDALVSRNDLLERENTKLERELAELKERNQP